MSMAGAAFLTLPEAQQTQGIECETWIISEAKINTDSIQPKK